MADKLEFAVEQQALAAIVQRWNPNYAKVIKAVDPDYLVADHFRWFVPKLQKFLEANDRPPPWEYVDVLIGREFTEQESVDQMRRIIYPLYSIEITWGTEAVQKFREHIAWRNYSAGIKEVQQGYKKSGSMDLVLAQARESLDHSIEILTDSDHVDVFDRFDEREATWMRERDNPGLRRVLRLFVPELDNAFRLEEGRVTAFLAPYGRGKSIALNHAGACAVAQGFNVAHVIFENSIEETLDRYYSLFTGITLNTLSSFTDNVSVSPLETSERYQRARQWMGALKSYLPNKIKILKVVPNKTTVQEIDDKLKLLSVEQNFIPDVTIWDYINIIGPSKLHKDKHDRQEQNAWDLKNHAIDTRNGGLNQRIVITAMQAKAQGIKKESLDQSDYGKSLGIMEALDNCIAINRTTQETHDEELRFGDLKHRGSKGLLSEIKVKTDYSRMIIDTRTWGPINQGLRRLVGTPDE